MFFSGQGKREDRPSATWGMREDPPTRRTSSIFSPGTLLVAASRVRWTMSSVSLRRWRVAASNSSLVTKITACTPS